MILCIETATSLCSVALCDNAGTVALREDRESRSHASLLTVFINELLREADIRPSDLEAIAVSKGPGSYTGLRIGVSAAKGISFAASIPLIGIETTSSMFWGLSENRRKTEDESNKLFCPMLDARRMEVYYAIYDCDGNTVKSIVAEVVDKDSFSDVPESQKIIFFGDGALKLKDLITRANIEYVDDFSMSASHLRIPAYRAFMNRKFEDVAYFEPLYLKDFITTRQKKNILGL
jgi:tRNA threonylcarbamoyladenosine biosynthesis protein TsaB